MLEMSALAVDASDFSWSDVGGVYAYAAREVAKAESDAGEEPGSNAVVAGSVLFGPVGNRQMSTVAIGVGHAAAVGVGYAAFVGPPESTLHGSCGNQITMEIGHMIAVEVATVGGQIAVEIAEVGRAVGGVGNVGPAGVVGVEV